MSNLNQITKVSAVGIGRVCKAFGDEQVLKEIDLSIKKGEFVSVIGPSGCGKTTLLRILGGLEEATSGSVYIDGASVDEARAGQEIGIAFQRPALIPSITALQNVQTTLDLCSRKSQLTPEKVLTDFGLRDYLNHYPHQLSGGMQQRVNIGCAMVHQPRLLLLDEPFGALDEMTRATMCRWLDDILQQTKQTSILVTHSIEEAVTLSDRVVVLAARPGRIAEVIPIELERPRLSWDDSGFLRQMKQVRQALESVADRGGVAA
ncbi:MAG: ABC transporter ATP-binding protein [Verrucomicrobiota bacterium]